MSLNQLKLPSGSSQATAAEGISRPIITHLTYRHTDGNSGQRRSLLNRLALAVRLKIAREGHVKGHHQPQAT